MKPRAKIFPQRSYDAGHPVRTQAPPVPGMSGSPSSRSQVRGGYIRSFTEAQLLSGTRFRVERPTLIRWNGWQAASTTRGFDYGCIYMAVALDSSGGWSGALPMFGNYTWIPTPGDYSAQLIYRANPLNIDETDNSVLATFFEDIDPNDAALMLGPNGPASTLATNKQAIAQTTMTAITPQGATDLPTGASSSITYGLAFCVSGLTILNNHATNAVQLFIGSGYVADVTAGITIARGASYTIPAHQSCGWSSCYVYAAGAGGSSIACTWTVRG